MLEKISVSASEKLKAMRAQALGELPYGSDPQVYGALAIDLMDTLPQILSVVQEAELRADEFLSLREALNALEEALS